MFLKRIIPNPIRKAYAKHADRVKREREERIREANRPYMPCSLDEGITQENMMQYVKEAIDLIHGRELEAKVDAPRVFVVVRSRSGLSVWKFSVDFNDYGHITGKYWINTENDQSKIPEFVASYIEKKILIKLGVIPDNNIVYSQYTKNREAKNDELVEYYCPTCGSILNKQMGFSPKLSAWICKNCGEQLMSEGSEGDVFKNVVWYCDNCGAILNEQKDFSEKTGVWSCTKCGFKNSITEKDIIEISKIKQ